MVLPNGQSHQIDFVHLAKSPQKLYLLFPLHLVYAAIADHNYGLRNGVDLRKDARVISNTIGKRSGVRYV